MIVMTPRLSYFICATPRSGSWLLAGGIEDARVAGHPSEWFTEQEEKVWCARWGLPYPAPTYEEYLEKVIEAGRAGTDIFGVKCLGQSFRDLIANLRTIPRYRTLPDSEVISAVFPNTRYVWLRRRDTARQAISYYRAIQTQMWFDMEGDPQPAGRQPQPIYDPVEIRRYEIVLKELEDVWQDYFRQSGLLPFTLYYEDLAADYQNTVRKVLRYIGIEDANSITISRPRFKKQADDITEDWVQRYQAHRANSGSS